MELYSCLLHVSILFQNIKVYFFKLSVFTLLQNMRNVHVLLAGDKLHLAEVIPCRLLRQAVNAYLPADQLEIAKRRHELAHDPRASGSCIFREKGVYLVEWTSIESTWTTIPRCPRDVLCEFSWKGRSIWK